MWLKKNVNSIDDNMIKRSPHNGTIFFTYKRYYLLSAVLNIFDSKMFYRCKQDNTFFFFFL